MISFAGKTYGYARVSSAGQQREGYSLASQRQQLLEAGADEVSEETASAAGSARPVLGALLLRLSPGDTLMVTRLDRLGRSVRQVSEMADELLQRQINIHVLNIGLMDASPVGKLLRNVMLAFAEFERDMLIERTREGREAARRIPGYKDGRKPKFSRAQLDHAMELLRTNTYKQTARLTGISVSTLTREHRRREAGQMG